MLLSGMNSEETFTDSQLGNWAITDKPCFDNPAPHENSLLKLQMGHGLKCRYHHVFLLSDRWSVKKRAYRFGDIMQKALRGIFNLNWFCFQFIHLFFFFSFISVAVADRSETSAWATDAEAEAFLSDWRRESIA